MARALAWSMTFSPLCLFLKDTSNIFASVRVSMRSGLNVVIRNCDLDDSCLISYAIARLYWESNA